MQKRLKNTALKCETAQYQQTICTVKSHSRALATFQNIENHENKGKLFKLNM